MTLSTCCRHSSTNRTNLYVLWRKSRHLPVRPSSGKTVNKPKFCQIKKTCLFLPPLSILKLCKRYFLTPCMCLGRVYMKYQWRPYEMIFMIMIANDILLWIGPMFSRHSFPCSYDLSYADSYKNYSLYYYSLLHAITSKYTGYNANHTS